MHNLTQRDDIFRVGTWLAIRAAENTVPSACALALGEREVCGAWRESVCADTTLWAGCIAEWRGEASMTCSLEYARRFTATLSSNPWQTERRHFCRKVLSFECWIIRGM